MRLLILMLKKKIKKAHDGKKTAYRTVDGKGLCFVFLFTYQAVRKEMSLSDCVQEIVITVFCMNAFLLFTLVVCASGCVLQGLTSHSTDTYETIRMDKKPIV